MAKSTTGSSGGRRQKTSRTIDLEANRKPDTAGEKTAGRESGKTGKSGTVGADQTTGGKSEPMTDRTSSPRPTSTKPPDSKSIGKKDAETGRADQSTNKPDTGGASVPPANSTSTGPASGTGRQAAGAKSGSTFPALLLAGLLGGGVALGGAGALSNSGVLSGVPLIGGLFGEGNNETGAALQTANDRIAELNERLSAIESQTAGADGADADALNERINELEARIQAASGSGGEAAQEALSLAQSAEEKAEAAAAQVARLNDQILQSSGGSAVDMEAVKSALSADTAALTARVEQLESAVGEPGGASGEAVSAMQNEIQTEIDAIKSEIAALTEIQGTLETVQGDTNALGETLTATRDSVLSMEDRIDGLEASLNDTILPSINEVEKAASAAIESQRVARSVSARALGTVLEQGGRFASELAAAEALVGGSEAIAGLRALSQTGILTEAELQQRFETVSTGILEREAGQAQGDGILDRFMSSARSLVQVRPAGPVEGDSTVAVVSRIDAALKQGDLAAAQSEWEQLNEEARAASANWAMALADRIRAEGLIEQVIGELSAQSGQEG